MLWGQLPLLPLSVTGTGAPTLPRALWGDSRRPALITGLEQVLSTWCPALDDPVMHVVQEGMNAQVQAKSQVAGEVGALGCLCHLSLSRLLSTP